MVKKDFVEPMSEIGNWNASRTYTEVEIAELVINTTKYLDIASNGTIDFYENFYYSDIQKDTLRLEGLKRAINELLKIVMNTRAFCKRKETNEDMLKFKEELRTIRDLLKKPIVYKITKDIYGNKNISLKIELFEKLVDKIYDIKEKMLEPLNINDLIMFHTENFDPKELKQKIIEDAINQG